MKQNLAAIIIFTLLCSRYSFGQLVGTKPNYANIMKQVQNKVMDLDQDRRESYDNSIRLNEGPQDYRSSDLCRDALSADLVNYSIRYENSSFKSWLYVYFSETEQNRKIMKSQRNFNSEINAVIDMIPVNFGISSNATKEHNYWSYKHQEWLETKEINTQDILFVSDKNVNENLRVWLECMKSKKIDNAANFTNLGVYVFIGRVREGRYYLEITNNSISDVEINEVICDPYVELEKSKSLKKGKKIGRRGGKSRAYITMKSGKDADFQVDIDVQVESNGDVIALKANYQKEELHQEIPIGTIIATTMKYEDFLQSNRLHNLTPFDQIWLPCDGRVVNGKSVLTRTPDLRGLFLRGANVMDNNERLHTGAVVAPYKNPDEPAPTIGEFQDDAYESHSHPNVATTEGVEGLYGGGAGLQGAVKAYDSTRYSTKNGSAETRPKNISVLYMIKVR